MEGAHMPPKAKITREMIINAAFVITRREGIDKVTARSISEQLSCSTQPVLYHFSTVEEIKKAVYEKADEYHSRFIMSREPDYGNPLLTIGMNYIRFAIEEKWLFHLLFQSNGFSGASMPDMITREELEPIMDVLRQELQVTADRAREIFGTLFIFAHGYASLFANNSIVYDETQLIKALTGVFEGAVMRKGD